MLCRCVFVSELSLSALLHMEVDGIEKSSPLQWDTELSVLTEFDMFSDDLVVVWSD